MKRKKKRKKKGMHVCAGQNARQREREPRERESFFIYALWSNLVKQAVGKEEERKLKENKGLREKAQEFNNILGHAPLSARFI
ncbi:hypothetical protein LOK49_LG08G00958 [Camellia lanceoleosa]|uniref:Uncharacterized protein n=1 Tax=Camellia lanceoleosa TaxID=1840588 RepID=A0ACC0GWV6_9ERIC|nr:hypothetical protein LOK49_LG08G00958 [Camellia lanceoleosa]